MNTSIIRITFQAHIQQLLNIKKRQKFHINNSNSLFPHGYNLTKGGKTLKHVNVINNENLNDYKKRGRQFGYKHNDQTKEKMSKRLKNICSNNVIEERMKSTMKNYYDTNKIKILETYNLDYNLEKYIKPVKKKNTDEIYDYVIKINGRKSGHQLFLGNARGCLSNTCRKESV